MSRGDYVGCMSARWFIPGTKRGSLRALPYIC